jgi:hypothetical protein
MNLPMLQKTLRNMLQYTARHAANMLQQTWSYLFKCVLSNPAISGGRACPKKGIVQEKIEKISIKYRSCIASEMGVYWAPQHNQHVYSHKSVVL